MAVLSGKKVHDKKNQEKKRKKKRFFNACVDPLPNTRYNTNISYKRDGVDGFGQILIIQYLL